MHQDALCGPPALIGHPEALIGHRKRSLDTETPGFGYLFALCPMSPMSPMRIACVRISFEPPPWKRVARPLKSLCSNISTWVHGTLWTRGRFPGFLAVRSLDASMDTAANDPGRDTCSDCSRYLVGRLRFRGWRGAALKKRYHITSRGIAEFRVCGGCRPPVCTASVRNRTRIHGVLL